MTRRLLPHPPGRLRRLGAVVALFGLVFASTVASISHSVAMPLMAGAVLAMLPPILIVIFMQRLFIRGLTETEK